MGSQPCRQATRIKRPVGRGFPLGAQSRVSPASPLPLLGAEAGSGPSGRPAPRARSLAGRVLPGPSAMALRVSEALPAQPGPEAVAARLRAVAGFLRRVLPLCSAHTVEFFTRGLWEELVALRPEAVLEALSGEALRQLLEEAPPPRPLEEAAGKSRPGLPRPAPPYPGGAPRGIGHPPLKGAQSRARSPGSESCRGLGRARLWGSPSQCR